MTIARKDIVASGEERDYHCTVRCVRQSFLCGTDTYTGRNYDHRKDWIRDRLIFLSEHFALDIIGYSVMSNHAHVIPRTRPAVTRDWSAGEVARRWLALFPPKRKNVDPAVAAEAAQRKILGDPARVEVLRERLGSLSWFMRCLDEQIARRANKEDGCKGRFWEGRFKCQALLDEGALLSCLTYVDLNPIRAGLAETPEESAYTSAQERIGQWQAAQDARLLAEQPELRAAGRRAEAPAEPVRLLTEPPAPLLADPPAEAPVGKRPLAGGWLCPLESQPGRPGAFRALSLEEYLRVLDATGREIRADKKGFIPPELAPILTRLAIRGERWAEAVTDYDRRFYRVVGRAEEVGAAARTAGRRWFQGLAACRAVFGAGG